MLLASLALTLAAGVATVDPAAVRPGQTGVCVTEWTGGVRREMKVEVLGTLQVGGPERHYVLVRLSDPELVGTGVVSGMSGSPVYIDGKLLGAVAIGWAFAREPIAGVTPFTVMQRMPEGASGGPPPPPTLQQLAALAAGSLEPLAVAPHLPEAPGRGTVTLAVAGLGYDDAFSQQLLGRAGMVTVPAGGRTDRSGVPEAGDMMAALLVWGDATVAAGGTVTARDGDTLWAFGHPMYGLGSVRLPVARATVLAVQASYQSPFKLFAVGDTFGTLVADRAPGIVARVGPPPAGIPVTVEVRDTTGTVTWRFSVAESPLLAPLMVTYLANACLTARGAAVGEASVRFAVRIALADGRRVEVVQAVRGIDALARTAAFAGAVTAALAASPLPHPDLAGVELLLERDERPHGATIVEVIPERTTLAPGEELAVAVRLQPHLGEPTTERLRLRVPAGLPAGPLDLIVADGATWSEYRLRTVPVTPVVFADLLTQIGTLESSTSLVAALERAEGGAAVPGGAMPGLPPSWSMTLATGLGRSSLPRLATVTLATSRWAAPYPLEGAYRLPLSVRPRLEGQ